MQWSKNVMQTNANVSRSSSRSLSKFKKIDLIKTQQEQGSNPNLQKSLLKLNSVQRVKMQHRNFLNNYSSNKGDKQKAEEQQRSRSKGPNSKANTQSKILRRDQSQSSHAQYYQQSGKGLFFNRTFMQENGKDGNCSQSKVFPKSVFTGSPKKKTTFAEFPQRLSTEQKISILVQNMRKLTQQFRTLCFTIKKQLNRQIQRTVKQFQTDIQNYLHQYATKLQMGIGTLSQFNTEKQFYSLNNSKMRQTSGRQSQSSYVQPNQVELKSNGYQQPFFKNKFQNMIGDRSKEGEIQNISNVNHQRKNAQKISNANQHHQRKRTQESSNSKSVKKIERKPISLRMNSFLKSDTSEDASMSSNFNNSNSSIRYQRVNDRSSSLKIKQMKQRVLSLKKIFNQSKLSQNNNTKPTQQSQVVQQNHHHHRHN